MNVYGQIVDFHFFIEYNYINIVICMFRNIPIFLYQFNIQTIWPYYRIFGLSVAEKLSILTELRVCTEGLWTD